MNIDPIGNSGYIPQSGRQDGSNGTPRANGHDQQFDRLATNLSHRVRETLASLPKIRPEMVERGRALLSDPNYPGQDVVRKIASLITPLPEI